MKHKFFIGICLSFAAAGLELGAYLPMAGAAVDNTYCEVRSNSDSIDDFHSLRRKMEEGFNRTERRACVEQISFAPGAWTIRLQKTLTIDNFRDLNCTIPGHPLCQDLWAFVLKGHDAVVIDASGLPAGTCAIRIRANGVLITDLTILVQRPEDAICDEGEDNDTTDVTVPEETPTPLPTPSPSATPSVSPEPSESPLPSPSPSASPSPTPSATPEPTPSPTASPTPTPSPTATPSPTPSPTADPDPDDKDKDGVGDGIDNCPHHSNTDQLDSDQDGIGDVCDPDFSVSEGDDDGDGVENEFDNCENVANPKQEDGDQDSLGDACDTNISLTEPERFEGFPMAPMKCSLSKNSRNFRSEFIMLVVLLGLPALWRLRCKSPSSPNPKARSTRFPS